MYYKALTVYIVSAEVSPHDNRDAHMLLVLDILEYDKHENLAEKVIQEYGKVVLKKTNNVLVLILF